MYLRFVAMYRSVFLQCCYRPIGRTSLMLNFDDLMLV
jgi:hypothetical protein